MNNEQKQRAGKLIADWYEDPQDNGAELAVLLQELIAEQPASVPGELPVNVLNAVADSLDDTYLCGRVWSAWHYGAMSEDDFTPAGEDLDTVVSVAKAAITAWLAAAPATAETGKESLQVQPAEIEHDFKDVRCGCCGYMTYHREHMGCIRAAAPEQQSTIPANVADAYAKYKAANVAALKEFGEQFPQGATIRISDVQAKSIEAFNEFVAVMDEAIAAPDAPAARDQSEQHLEMVRP